MILTDIPAGSVVFVDSNILIFAFTNHPVYGIGCQDFLDRVGNQEISAVTSTHNLGEVVHRIMTIEACDRFGWPVQGTANRLRRHPAEVQQLTRFRQVLEEINAARVTTLLISPALIYKATELSQQMGFLYGDALLLAVMRDHGLTPLASLDADFDRVAGLTRFAPA